MELSLPQPSVLLQFQTDWSLGVVYPFYRGNLLHQCPGDSLHFLFLDPTTSPCLAYFLVLVEHIHQVAS